MCDFSPKARLILFRELFQVFEVLGILRDEGALLQVLDDVSEALGSSKCLNPVSELLLSQAGKRVAKLCIRVALSAIGQLLLADRVLSVGFGGAALVGYGRGYMPLPKLGAFLVNFWSHYTE